MVSTPVTEFERRASSHDLQWRWARSTTVIFAAALIVRLAFVLVQCTPRGFALPPQWDDRHFHAVALNILQGKGVGRADGAPTAWHPPLLYFFVATIYAAFGARPLCVYLANVIALASVPLLVRCIGRRWFGETAGLLSAWLCVLWPPLIYSASRYQKETLVIPLVLASILCWLLAWERKTPQMWLATGLLFALTVLGRPEYAIAALFFGILLAIRLHATPQRAILAGASFAFPIVLLVGGWIARNAYHFGAFVPVSSAGGSVLYRCNHDDAILWQISEPVGGMPVPSAGSNEAERSRLYRSLAIQWIQDNPERWATNALKKLWFLWGPVPHLESVNKLPPYVHYTLTAANVIILIPAYGVLLAGRLFAHRPPIELLLLMLQTSLVALFFWANHRLRAPVDALLIACAAAALVRLFAALRSTAQPA